MKVTVTKDYLDGTKNISKKVYIESLPSLNMFFMEKGVCSITITRNDIITMLLKEQKE